MTPDEVGPMLDALAAKVDSVAALPAVTAMAHTFERAVKRILSLRTRGATEFRPHGERGEPPAMRSGRLRASVYTFDVSSSGATAHASVAPHTIYAGVQEFGEPDPIRARRRKYMHFWSGGEWFLERVHVGPNPYMRPALAACIANGSLGDAAAKAFEIAVW